jgi:uncharacterized tellurite resistance protein B-like protein
MTGAAQPAPATPEGVDRVVADPEAFAARPGLPAGDTEAADAPVPTIAWGVLPLWLARDPRPAFLSRPLDIHAAALFDIAAGLAVLVARRSGEVDAAERAATGGHAVTRWGLDPAYVAAALPEIEARTRGRRASEVVDVMDALRRRHPGFDRAAFAAEAVALLQHVAGADGQTDTSERAAIARIGDLLAGGGWSLGAMARSAVSGVASAPGRLLGLVSGDRDRGAEVRPPAALPVPTLWLLGKTGAGKTSLVRAMTGATRAEIGSGFESCTRTACAYDFPAAHPVMRFLDTRGLGEIDYDPADDLAQIGSAAHATLAVMRLDDPVQGTVAQALARSAPGRGACR